MQALIPAAGMAVRMRPLSLKTHKCLFKIGGKPIIYHMFSNLQKCGISSVVMALGYKSEQIKRYINENFRDFKVSFVVNEKYETTNNAYSVWLAKDAIKGSFVLLDSDILFDYRIIKKLLAGRGSRIAVHFKSGLGEEEVKVKLGKGGRVLEIGKEIKPSLAAGESVGIELFTKELGKALFGKLEEQIVKRKITTQYYESAFQELLDSGKKMTAVGIGGYACMELDTPEDLKKAEKEVLPLLP